MPVVLREAKAERLKDRLADVDSKALIDTITIGHNLAATIANAEAEKLGDTEWLVAIDTPAVTLAVA